MSGPVVDLPTLQSALDRARHLGATVVLTNGVFDLLHVGHLRYLRQAREQGDLLVVGVNADASVDKAGRPLVPQNERAELLAALEPVNYVVIFAERTADELLRAIRPAVYVKGADYSENTLPERETVRQLGVRLVFVPLVADHSTTALAEALSRARSPRKFPAAPRQRRSG